MPFANANRWQWRALLVAALAAVLVCTASTGPARAGDDETQNADDGDDWIDTKILKGPRTGT